MLHLLVLSALLLRLLLVLLNDEQELIDLLFGVIDMQLLLAGKFLHSTPRLPSLPFQRFYLIGGCFELHLQFLQVHSEIFLVLEQLGDELEGILHHVAELLLLLLQRVLKLRLEYVL